MKPEVPLPAKKSYKPPQLAVYGDIRELTQTLSTGTGKDSLIGPGNKATH